MKKRRRGFGFVGILLIVVLGFVVFQVINPLQASAPTSSETKVINEPLEAKAKTDQAIYQQVDDGRAKVSVLMYHHISPMPDPSDKIRYNLTVSPEEFEAQVKYLADNSFSFLTLSSLYNLIDQNKVPEKVVVLTFDDGYEDNFKYARPVLEKYNATGTFFVITNKIDKAEYLTTDQVKELSYNYEIGSHSYSHPELVRLSDYYLERELKKSKDDLESIIERGVTSFCYPAGKYDDKTLGKVKDYGYKMAVTTKASDGEVDISDLLQIPRYRMSPGRSIEVLID